MILFFKMIDTFTTTVQYCQSVLSKALVLFSAWNQANNRSFGFQAGTCPPVYVLQLHFIFVLCCVVLFFYEDTQR